MSYKTDSQAVDGTDAENGDSDVSVGKQKLVQMRFSSTTMDAVKRLKRLTGITNRTQLTASAVQLTAEIKDQLAEGGRLCIERPDGTKDYITIVGI